MQPLITLFTAPKPFKDPHIRTIQTNAIRSWLALSSIVDVILVGDEEGVKSFAQNNGVHYEPAVKRNAQGTPLISSIFEIGRQQNQSPLLAYINADIILFSDFVETSQKVMTQAEKFLLVGQRWDMDIRKELDFSEGWQQELKAQCAEHGRLHPRGGSDYFIYPRECFQTIPDFAVGRAGWDNWMFYQARRNNWKTIDATHDLQVIHQDHDYSHLPQGQPHYRLPETTENVRMAGGRRMIFTLMDVNFEIVDGKLQKFPIDQKKFWREVEIFPLISLHSKILANLIFAVFHPKRAYQEIRNWLGQRRNRME